jgi:hypothetical protein
MTFGRLLDANQMPQQRAFAAARSTHDDERGAFFDFEVQIMLDDARPVGHGQIHGFDRAIGLYGVVFHRLRF